MKKAKLFLSATVAFMFAVVAAGSDDPEVTIPGLPDTEDQEDPVAPEINYDEYNIINNAEGAVEEITDNSDSQALDIVQTIPSADNYDSETTFPANLPISLFFDDKILLSSIADNFIVKVDNKEVKGTIVINESANGYAILTFVPWVTFEAGSKVEVIVKAGLMDDGGNTMYQDIIIIYYCTPVNTNPFDDNKGFENGLYGVQTMGDANVLSAPFGDLEAYEGKGFGIITSGYCLVSENNSIGDASSSIFLGPIKKTFTTLSFHYDFISAEFNEYVFSAFDDVAIVTIVGPYGAYSSVINTVNLIAYENEQINIPGMPDGGDYYTGHTGWRQYTINLPYTVGTPAYISFTVSDVADHALSTLFAIDDIKY